MASLPEGSSTGDHEAGVRRGRPSQPPGLGWALKELTSTSMLGELSRGCSQAAATMEWGAFRLAGGQLGGLWRGRREIFQGSFRHSHTSPVLSAGETCRLGVTASAFSLVAQGALEGLRKPLTPALEVGGPFPLSCREKGAPHEPCSSVPPLWGQGEAGGAGAGARKQRCSASLQGEMQEKDHQPPKADPPCGLHSELRARQGQ